MQCPGFSTFRAWLLSHGRLSVPAKAPMNRRRNHDTKADARSNLKPGVSHALAQRTMPG